ncbi:MULTISPECIES: xanthine dehydrogenase family protein molybdopterin-binding subunit [Cupriavidus]|uniref:Xanthine dehydrogenase family protein n=1 Tax=Cupriavidus basilensis TaxID=68895 RepID=A0A643G0U2_9BURK|nr:MULTISPECIES: xanthine dehydrogenase family protein molybdopterin-binding subunit [Cupriavidus]KUE88038.1 carbon monoxide dehydrogenase [Cupriavidus necator]NOV23815.1 xanthine dehydrogenase family protein molybdopterin-binding subunit [Cupriavidus necator]QOT81862.1 xanthine dehydrogenase family protein [Cupriavidus basilensis]BDB30276.1 xanthine dehydrogenase family protein [Cupriavidus sp. P-10]
MTERYIPDVKIPASRQSEAPRQNLRWIGKSMKRVEDPRLLTGRGKYVDDIVLPNMAHVALLRSPFAHARIKSIDVSRARELPGVIAVVTGKEFAETTGPTVTFSSPPVVQHAIAIDRVRHVGEAVAAVVAVDRYIAEDALELIDVDFEELPVVADFEAALHAKGEAVLHPDLGDSNVAMDRTFAFGPVDDDFARSDLVIKRRLRWNRSGPQPLETVGAVAEYDPGTGKFTVHCNTSMYTYVGWLCAASLGVPSTQLNIVPTLAGGSFGSKLFLHKVIVLTAGLARIAGQPVKFIEDRLDNMTNADGHGSDRVYEAELAVKRDGTILSLRYEVMDDYGAYLQYGYGTHGNAFSQIVGPYRINSVQARIIAVLTNKCQQGAYRGFGSEVSNFVIERMVDAAARELNLDPVEIRRRNLIRPEEFPFVIPTGNVYDSGNYQAVMQEMLRMFDYEGWRARQEAARKEGKYIGIGVVTCQERSVFSSTEFWSLNPPEQPGFALTSSPEAVSMRIDPTGKVFVKLNAPFWGNSPETVVTQIVSEALSVEPSDISVSYADTDAGFNGTGPGGSRYTVMVAGAVVAGSRTLRNKMFRFAAHMLECSSDDLELSGGRVIIKGIPGSGKTIAELASAIHYFRLDFPDTPEFSSGLETTSVYDHPLTTMPASDRSHLGIFYPIMGHMAHAAAVEVDPQTGKVTILDYVAVHDCGTVVNPMTLDGHVRGGAAQGIGTALYEQFHYDSNGQLLTASFADYHMPTAHEVPLNLRVGHVETPSPYTEFGIKGGGEGGRMAAPPVMVQAVEDALRPYGVELTEVPLTPSRIRRIVREAQCKNG